MQRLQANIERREAEFAEARRKEAEEARARQEAAVAYEAGLLRNAHEARIAELEQRHADLEANVLEFGRTILHAVERVADERVDLSRDQREEIRDLKAEVAKLGSTLAELRGGSDFRFAREKDAVADLPDFLAPRRVVN
jgi:hypothetical protein